MTPLPRDPEPDCALCPRLAEFRAAQRIAEPHWFNAPVPSFGDPHGRLLIVGLAPGLRGANRTGRPFTGDYAGELLYRTLADFGFAEGIYEARADDGLRLVDATITNAVRCVPPKNRPKPEEIRNCRIFLQRTLEALAALRVILVLGRIAHDATVAALGEVPARHPFGHGRRHDFRRVRLFDSYHCSRYNTNTGRLTEDMFRKVLAEVRKEMDSGG